MQGLGDVADKVDEELEGLLGVGGREAAVADALRVVDNGRDGAARGAAVAVVVDVAAGGRVVLGVDVVQRRGPRAGRCRAVVVGPRGNVGKVRVRVVVEDALGPVRGGGCGLVSVRERMA